MKKKAIFSQLRMADIGVDHSWQMFIGYLHALRQPTMDEIVEAALFAAIDEDLVAELAIETGLLNLG